MHELSKPHASGATLAAAILACVCWAAGIAPAGAGGVRDLRGQGSGSTPAQTESREAFPVTISDDAGIPVSVQRKPRRIVSLASFTDDVLLDLVSPDRLIGVTAFSVDPDISNVVGKAAAVRHKLLVNVEVVVSLQPDLVFVANWTDASEVAQLRGSGVPVFLLATGRSVDEIQRQIRTIARLVGEAEAGAAMVAEMERRLAAVDGRLAALSPAQRRTVMDYTTWGSSQGHGSSWDEIVKRAGLINAVSAFAADDWGQVTLSKEVMLRLDPDILILPGWVYGNPSGATSFHDSVVHDPALRSLRAVRERRVFSMPEGLRAASSQYIVEAIEYLARLAYPELWQEGSAGPKPATD